MERNRRHFRRDLSKEEVIATLTNSKGEKIKSKVNDVSKQGISFFAGENRLDNAWKKEAEVLFVYKGQEYKMKMKFVRDFKVNEQRFHAWEFEEKEKIKMSRLSLHLMKEKLKED